jgi:hypothetical protein
MNPRRYGAQADGKRARAVGLDPADHPLMVGRQHELTCGESACHAAPPNRGAARVAVPFGFGDLVAIDDKSLGDAGDAIGCELQREFVIMSRNPGLLLVWPLVVAAYEQAPIMDHRIADP